MSLERAFALAIVAIWLVIAVFFAVSDAGILIDPVSRHLERVCSQSPGLDADHSSVYLSDLTDRECLPRIAVRAGFDALMVGLPLMVGFALVSRHGHRRLRRSRRQYEVLSSSVSSEKSSRFPRK